ncbi:U2 snRNP-associated protein Msl1 [Schizosaccharomyces japonicus yFS275]|uniref:U2 snRNP-associated protein Msl1 n=1 Tax=Schizosaccharomyces japonicus (strain yFS275 / FY16936) TaxID=402676 RepID=B6K4I6_SCHJY|nr:U2 snRNP-associated protein Msl1 [Schizosaccharomyces japonicus yFS275]EEB08393.1 U2 snRNP-associated protein Msl1 [Schizosaccharomyces japonicus yFS275]
MESHTLYVNNLNEKLRKEDLRTSLYLLFSTYGTVLDVVALKTPKMRGQAHIVFHDQTAAAIAKKTLTNFMFFGKEMHIEYAKSRSHALERVYGHSNINRGFKRALEGPEENEAPKRLAV